MPSLQSTGYSIILPIDLAFIILLHHLSRIVQKAVEQQDLLSSRDKVFPPSIRSAGMVQARSSFDIAA
ncbi:hypothetical protein [Bacillus sp. REN3]|uniref:hypothetical protein n=1 Tax=Bacillus sp. REN3 TaxID=2802440 RepID=UPI001AED2F80|nr:hypothetical protein [Bacillus sp. REN3]